MEVWVREWSLGGADMHSLALERVGDDVDIPALLGEAIKMGLHQVDDAVSDLDDFQHCEVVNIFCTLLYVPAKAIYDRQENDYPKGRTLRHAARCAIVVRHRCAVSDTMAPTCQKVADERKQAGAATEEM